MSGGPVEPGDPFVPDPFAADPFAEAYGTGVTGEPRGEHFEALASDPFADGVVEEVFDSRSTAGVPVGAARAYWGGASSAQLGVEDLIRQAVEAVASARRAPLSASVLVARDELLEVLQRALDALPEELRRARWLLRERDEFLAQRQREADSLMEEVRAQAQRMVQRTEIVRQANQVAQRIVADAREDARRLRHEAEDFCDKKLAAFEIVLERTARTVRAGRQHLAGVSAQAVEETGAAAGAEGLVASSSHRVRDRLEQSRWGGDPEGSPGREQVLGATAQSRPAFGVDWAGGAGGDRPGTSTDDSAADALFDQDSR